MHTNLFLLFKLACTWIPNQNHTNIPTLLGGSEIKYGCVQLSGDTEQPDLIDILPLQVGTNFCKIYKINCNPYFGL